LEFEYLVEEEFGTVAFNWEDKDFVNLPP